MRLPRRLLLAPAAFAAAPLLPAQDVTVDIALEDVVDFGGAQQVADLPGPDGHVSLREAITAANNTPGPQTILFAIPRREWSIFYDDRALIRHEYLLYVSDADTTIDFSSQTAFTGDTNPNGNEVGLQYASVPSSIPNLWLAADRCTVRGLDVTIGNNFGGSIWITGSHCRVVGCTTYGASIKGDYGGGAFNVIGGTAPGEGNVFASGVGIYADADDNRILGNVVEGGVAVTGDTFWGSCDRNHIGGPSPAERNVISGHGYYGEEGFPLGTQLSVQHATATWIEGNYVGLTADGLAKYPGASGTGGIVIGTGAADTMVRGNLVAGILMIGSNHYQGQRFGTAIAVSSTAARTTLVGNTLGLAADGTTPIPSREGIVVQTDFNGSPTGVTIGGSSAGANEIAFQETNGVRVSGSARGVLIRANAIHDNGALGIDLVGTSGFGVTLNDLRDPDSGGNQLQNYPLLARAALLGAAGAGQQVRVTGNLNSTPNQDFTLDFYANAACDPSGHGEGERYLGTIAVRTDAAGDARFAAALPWPAGAGANLAATAIDAAGNTSEFSPCIPVARPGFAPPQ